MDYKDCCGRYIEGQESAPTPEALMRSRYTAFTQQNMDYLLVTHDPQTRDQFDLETNAEWAKSVRFMGLEVLNSEAQGTKGIVEFRATFQDLKTNQNQTHHELSRFRKHKEKWYFKEGKIKQ
jgi:SEC-C motif-containing protein